MKSVVDVVVVDSATAAELLERLRRTSPTKYARVVLRLSATVHAMEAAADACQVLVPATQIGPN